MWTQRFRRSHPITWLMAMERPRSNSATSQGRSQWSSFHLILSKWERHIKGFLVRLIFSIRTSACDLSVFHGLIPVRRRQSATRSLARSLWFTSSAAGGRRCRTLLATAATFSIASCTPSLSCPLQMGLEIVKKLIYCICWMDWRAEGAIK